MAPNGRWIIYSRAHEGGGLGGWGGGDIYHRHDDAAQYIQPADFCPYTRISSWDLGKIMSLHFTKYGKSLPNTKYEGPFLLNNTSINTKYKGPFLLINTSMNTKYT